MDFILQKDEKILKELRPQKQFIYMALLKLFGLVILLVLLFIPNIFYTKGIESTVVLGIIFILMILWGIFVPILRYSKEYYWITNKRIAIKKGVIGYSITSIPYAKISDLIVSRNFFEQIFRVGSIYIQTLAGQISGKNTKGAEGYLAALDTPEEIQELIFKQMK